MELELFADYFQFYIQDESVDGNLGDSWNEEAVNRLLALAPGTVGIGTARNMDVPVVLEIIDLEPNSLNEDFYDQINECSILISSGKLVIAGCTEYFRDAMRVELENGWYRVRISYANLTDLSEDGLDGNDRYDIQMWQENSERPVTILKQRTA